MIDLAAMARQRRNRAGIYSTAEYWDGKAKTLSGSAISMWKNQSLNRHYEAEQFRFLERHLPDVRGKRVLDIGCGTGRVARRLHARGAIVTGTDFSAHSLAEAERIGPPEIEYRQGSVLDLNEPESYDVVVGVGVLTVACRNEEELKATLARIHAAIKPGGKFISIEPLHRGFLHRVLVMSHEDFLEAMRAQGFTAIDRHELHFWPARIVLSMFEWPGWLTALGYGCGQLAMTVFGNLFRMGDYKGSAGVRSQ